MRIHFIIKIEASGFWSQRSGSRKKQSCGRDGINQNEVKSITAQLLPKCEDSAPNTFFFFLRNWGFSSRLISFLCGGGDSYFPKKCVCCGMAECRDSFCRKCLKYDVLSQPWDSLWRPMIVMRAKRLADLVKESFKLGMKDKWDINPCTSEDKRPSNQNRGKVGPFQVYVHK